jgi:hypothetical protein
MAFTLWLSAEEEDLLSRIMRQEGTHNKQQAVIAAIREKGAKLVGDQPQDRPAEVSGERLVSATADAL